MTRTMPAAIAVLFLLPFLAACSGSPASPRPVATISHVVFVNLADPSDADELLADGRAMLATIPTVTAYSAGPHIDTGRATVLDDYDIGMILGFDDVEGLNAYVVHPDHVAFVDKWRPRLTGLRVYDIHDP
ncbi:MAG: Dabb family protein [Phycisphaerales bacterium]|nr:Dabb family protein [Planctomycetota bacterium]MCH8509877.1 Dabb family protein [Phycisphaerales bacterium]